MKGVGEHPNKKMASGRTGIPPPPVAQEQLLVGSALNPPPQSQAVGKTPWG